METNVIKVGIGILVIRDGQVLLGHRKDAAKDTGGIYEPGSWCLPGGKQEYGETIFEGAAREVKEETGLTVSDLTVFGAADDIQPNKHFVTVQVLARASSGEARVMEPDKQDAWRWFPLNALPEHVYTPSKKFLDAYILKTASQYNG